MGLLGDWFQAEFPDQVRLINSGGSGQNSRWGVEQVAEKVVAHAPDLVLIEFSYNDAHVKFAMSVEESVANLRTMVDAILAAKPGTAILVQTMNAPWDAPAKPNEKDRAGLAEYNRAWLEFAAERGLGVVAHYPVWQALKEKDFARYQKLVPDGSHPTPEASAEVTWAGLRAGLEAARIAAVPVEVMALYVSPGHNFFGHYGKPPGRHETLAVEEISCVAGRGIEGDRFYDYKPDYKGQITFFSYEVYQELCRRFGKEERLEDTALFRRNVITRGIDLDALIGAEFTLGGLRFKGAEECRPCEWMDGFHPGAYDALKGRGGLRARILEGGALGTGRYELRGPSPT